MNAEEKARLMQAWQGAAGMYLKPGQNVPDATLKLVVQLLANYELADVLRALSSHALDPDSGQFMPKPADIVRRIEGDGQSAGLRAWTEAINAASRVGGDQSVCFDNPLTMQVIDDMGGWIAICESQVDDHKFLQAEFNRRYQGYRSRSPGKHPTKLMGRLELHNAAQWPDRVPPLVFIGDPQRARMVHESGGASGGGALQVTQDLPDMIKLVAGGGA